MDDVKISELHRAALKEFEGDEEAARFLSSVYDKLKQDYIALIKELRELRAKSK